MGTDSRAYVVPIVHTRLKPGRERGQNGWLQITGKTGNVGAGISTRTSLVPMATRFDGIVRFFWRIAAR